MINIYKYIQKKLMASTSNMDIDGVDSNDELNGTIFYNSVIPPDVIMLIMEFLDRKSILACRLVCKNWEELVLLTIQSLYRHRFSLPTDGLSLPYLYIRLYTSLINRNLLKNVNGEEGFTHWDIIRNEGNEFAIENVPVGADPLPTNIEEFNGRTSCFVTSYRTCSKRQVIRIPKNSLMSCLLEDKPKIYASEWVAARFDCGARYTMTVALCRGNKEIIRANAECTLVAGDTKWKKMEAEIKDYPGDITAIVFEHDGQDTQFWAGHYGIKMAGAVLKFLPTK